MIEAVRGQVYREKLETVQGQLKVIEERLAALQHLRRLEASLETKKQHPKVGEALTEVGQARQAIAQQQDDQAGQHIEAAQAILDSLQTSLMGPTGQPDPDVSLAAEAAGLAGAATGQAAQKATTSPALPESWQRLKRFLIGLSGLSDEIRAEATLWLVRPLLYVALLLGLLAVGLSSLYVDKGATFGTAPFPDAVGLVLWGLSADVASRTLSGLKGGQG
jgi:hypothetical protein